MSERLPEPERRTIYNYLLQNRSLNDWHTALTRDQEGNYAGYFACPGSRYGRTADECAWWAIAVECIFIEANGVDEDVSDGLDYLMGLVVNDCTDIAELAVVWWFSIPEPLQEHIGTLADAKKLLVNEGGE